MATLSPFESVHQLVASIGTQVEEMEELKEDARKLYRLVKRAELLVTDLQPYADEERTSLYASMLQELLNVLQRMQSTLRTWCTKGKLSLFLQADRMLATFRELTEELDSAVAQLQHAPTSLQDETRDGIETLHRLVQRATFELPAQQQATLDQFRGACDSLREPFAQLRGSFQQILESTGRHGSLSREEYETAVGDLKREVTKFTEEGKNDKYYLRMVMAELQMTHQKLEPPVDFTCPLTCKLMQEPVLLFETGHSYERTAIEEWFAKGHRICPKTGVQIKRLNISPNHSLKSAIHRWLESGDTQLHFRPLLGALNDASREELAPHTVPAFGLGTPLDSADEKSVKRHLEALLGEKERELKEVPSVAVQAGKNPEHSSGVASYEDGHADEGPQNGPLSDVTVTDRANKVDSPHMPEHKLADMDQIPSNDTPADNAPANIENSKGVEGDEVT